jgi:hypothetical protein
LLVGRGTTRNASLGGVATASHGFPRPVKKKPRLGTTGLKSKATSIVERVTKTIIAGTVHAHSVLEARRPKISGVVSFSPKPKGTLIDGSYEEALKTFTHS